MNRTGLFVLIAAVIALAAGAFWYMSRSANQTASAPQVATETSTPPAPSRDQPAPPAEGPPVAKPPTGGLAPAEPSGGGAAPTAESEDATHGDTDKQAMRQAQEEERRARAARDEEEARSANAESAEQAQGSVAAAPPPPPPPPPPPSSQATPGGFATTPAPTRSATTTAAAIPEDIPIFPWPVPQASATQEVPRKLILGNTSAPTFGSVAERIASALDHAGYGERSYYALSDGHGIAIATQLEQINDDGTPVVGVARFEEKLAPLSTEQFSLTSYVKALFTARSGRFRIIVFTLSGGVAQNDKPPSEDQAKTWATSGQTHLPQHYALIPFTDQVTCTALIYEFEKKDYAAAASFVQPGKITGMSHLIKAGIWTLLGK